MNSPVTKKKITIERQDSLQVETNTITGQRTKSKITWITPCEYKITAMSSNSNLKDGVDSFFSITPITIAIVTTGKDFYVFNAKVDSATKHLDYTDTIRISR